MYIEIGGKVRVLHGGAPVGRKPLKVGEVVTIAAAHLLVGRDGETLQYPIHSDSVEIVPDDDEGVGGVAGSILSWMMIAKGIDGRFPESELEAAEKRYYKALDEVVIQPSETAMDFFQKLRLVSVFGSGDEPSNWEGFPRFLDSLRYDFIRLISRKSVPAPRLAAAE